MYLHVSISDRSQPDYTSGQTLTVIAVSPIALLPSLLTCKSYLQRTRVRDVIVLLEIYILINEQYHITESCLDQHDNLDSLIADV